MQMAQVGDEQGIIRVECVGSMTLDFFLSGGDPLADPLGGTSAYARRVLLNLEKVDFIDSSGVGWLIKWHQRFKKAGGIFVIHSLPPLIRNMLKLLQLDKILELAEDEAAARQLAQRGEA
jgi:ABC-type transporter Mla MlaB component